MGDFSTELCGGTHTKNTSEIAFCKIVAQSSVGANLRRVECVTGRRAWEWVQERESLMHKTAHALSIAPDALERSVEKLLEENKRLERQLAATQQKMAASRADELATQGVRVQGSGFDVNVVSQQVEGLSADALRSLADQIAEKIHPGVVVLGTLQEGKVVFIVKATPEAVQHGAHAGNLVREVAKRAGGSGGGRPDFAQAGGKQPEKLSEALAAVPELVSAQIK
jgi:alanyl-tRNA synthetase